MKKLGFIVILLFIAFNLFAVDIKSAINNCSLEELKKCVELLDYDLNEKVNDKSLMVNFLEQLSNKNSVLYSDKKINDILLYLIDKNIPITVDELFVAINNYQSDVLDLLFKSGKLDLNMKIEYDKNTKVSIPELFMCCFDPRYYQSFYYLDKRGNEISNWIITLALMQEYFPKFDVSKFTMGDSFAYFCANIITGNIDFVKTIVKTVGSEIFDYELVKLSMLFATNEMVDYLKQLEVYHPCSVEYFTPAMGPFFVEKFIPKYLSSYFTEDEIRALQLIVNLDNKQDRTEDKEELISMIEKGLNLDKQIQCLQNLTLFQIALSYSFDSIELICSVRMDLNQILDTNYTGNVGKTKQYYFENGNYLDYGIIYNRNGVECRIPLKWYKKIDETCKESEKQNIERKKLRAESLKSEYEKYKKNDEILNGLLKKNWKDFSSEIDKSQSIEQYVLDNGGYDEKTILLSDLDKQFCCEVYGNVKKISEYKNEILSRIIEGYNQNVYLYSYLLSINDKRRKKLKKKFDTYSKWVASQNNAVELSKGALLLLVNNKDVLRNNYIDKNQLESIIKLYSE